MSCEWFKRRLRKDEREIREESYTDYDEGVLEVYDRSKYLIEREVLEIWDYSALALCL